MCGYGGMADTLASGANGSNTVQVQVLLSAPFLFLKLYRDVAQFGRALRSGRRGRGFESRHLDQKKARLSAGLFNFSLYFSVFQSVLSSREYVNAQKEYPFLCYHGQKGFLQRLSLHIEQERFRHYVHRLHHNIIFSASSKGTESFISMYSIAIFRKAYS